MRAQMFGQSRAGFLERRTGPRRQDEQMRAVRLDNRLAGRRLFDNDVYVGAADAESADAGTAGRTGNRGPLPELGVDEKRRAGEIDLRIGLPAVQRRRQHAVLQREHCLDEAGNACRVIQVADVRLDRADGAEATPVRALRKHVGESRNFNRVAERRACSMPFDISDRRWRRARDGVSARDDVALTVEAGRGIAALGRPVIVDGTAADDGMDSVAVGERRMKRLQ